MMAIRKIFMCALIMTLLFSQNVYAADITETSMNNQMILDAAVNMCEDAGTVNRDGIGVQASLFSDMGVIERKAVCLAFLSLNQTTLGMGDKELNIHLKDLNSDVVAFNDKYANNSSVLSFRIYDSNNYNKKKYIKYVQETCAGKMLEYLTNYNLALPKDGAGMLDEEAIREIYSTEISTLYGMVDDVLDVQKTIAAWCTSDGFIMTDIYKNTLDEIYSTYTRLLDLAKELTDTYSEGYIYVDDTAAYIQSMTSAVFDSGGNISISDNPKLTLAYLACIASSAVYVPFVSYSGSSEFLKSLESLADKNTSESLLRMYSATKGLKKPLYRRKISSSGVPTGSAELITVGDLVEDIQSGSMGALCTIIGDFIYDDTTWLYSGRSIQTTDDEVITNFNGKTAQFDLEGFSLVIKIDSGTNSEEDVSQKRTGLFNVYATSDKSLQKSDEDSLVTYSNKVITDEAVMSQPVMMYGTVYARSVDNLTTALLYNVVMTNMSAVNKVVDKHLYMNVFGDVVTEDDLIVLPAAANPLYYKGGTYNPFTVAFMNSYPNTVKDSGVFRLASKADVGKYMIFGYWDNGGTSYAGFAGVKTVSISMVDPKGPIMMPDMQTAFTANFGRDSVSVFRTKKMIFSDTELWSDSSQYDKYCPLIINSNVTVNGKCVFPYEVENDQDYVLVQAIANNMYAYYAVDSKTFVQENEKNLNDNYITEVCIVNGFGGTDNSVGYERELKYDLYADNTTLRKYKSLNELSNNLFSSIRDVSGVIGIKSIYDNKVAGTVLSFLREYWYLFFLMVAVILLFHFSRVKMDLFQAVMFSIATLTVSYLYVSILPNLVPICFNLFTNNVAQGISYRVLALDAEHFLMDGSTVDASGDFDFDSASITIYKMKESEVDEILERVNLTRKDIIGGKYYVLNSNAGVYLKNNEICVNTNILFDTLDISGGYDTNNNYTLSIKKTVSSNVDYYIPYLEIVNSLTQKVNDLSSVYKIPRNTSTYANGRLRDNYLLYSYVNSKPFLTPGNYSFSRLTDLDAWTAEERAAYAEDAMQISENLYDIFGDNYDWLGISSWLGNLSSEEKKTLWAMTLQDLGYYDTEWNVNADKMNDLVNYVNYQTRKFVYDMSDQIGVLSDDVMIKIVALRALVALTQRASDFGHWMYPFTVNYEDMTLNNVLRSAIISNYDKYVSFDMDVTAYVLEEHGWFNLIMFDIASILSYVVTVAIDNIVPLFYLMLFAVLALRLCFGNGIKEALKGYLKVSFVIMLLSMAGTMAMIVAESMDGGVFAIYFIFIFSVLELAVLFWVITSVFRNVTEFGNATLTVRSLAGIKNLKNLKNHSMKTDSLQYSRRGRRMDDGWGYDNYSRYDINATIDDFYGYNQYPQQEDTIVGTDESNGIVTEFDQADGVVESFDSDDV